MTLPSRTAAASLSPWPNSSMKMASAVALRFAVGKLSLLRPRDPRLLARLPRLLRRGLRLLWLKDLRLIVPRVERSP